MPPVETLQNAVNIAENLLKKYYPFYKLLTAKKEDDTWLVEFDVGDLSRQLVRILLDAQSGNVLEYVSPDSS